MNFSELTESCSKKTARRVKRKYLTIKKRMSKNKKKAIANVKIAVRYIRILRVVAIARRAKKVTLRLGRRFRKVLA